MEPICDYCKGAGHVRYDGNAFVPCADVHMDSAPCHVCDNTGSTSEAAMHWCARAQAAEARVAELEGLLRHAGREE